MIQRNEECKLRIQLYRRISTVSPISNLYTYTYYQNLRILGDNVNRYIITSECGVVSPHITSKCVLLLSNIMGSVVDQDPGPSTCQDWSFYPGPSTGRVSILALAEESCYSGPAKLEKLPGSLFINLVVIHAS